MPAKPRPGQPKAPRPSNMLAAMFTPFTTKSVHMLLLLSCMPMNHPRKAIRLSVAGAAQTLMKKYSLARETTSRLLLTSRRASLAKGHCRSRTAAAKSSARPRPRPSILPHSRFASCPMALALPKAWAVSPPVPVRRKPKFQYSRLNIMPPTDIAPRKAADPAAPGRCPATAVSTSPTSGTVRFARMLGMASLSISLSNAERMRLLPEFGVFFQHPEV